MERGIQVGAPVDLHHSLRAVPMDVINDYAFNKSYHFLDREDLGAYFFNTIHGIGQGLDFPAIPHSPSPRDEDLLVAHSTDF
jgi:hypothetical protein